MKQLRLGHLLPTLAERITLAEKESLGLQDFLLVLFTDEVERRKSTASTRRAATAGLHPDMVLERWDKTAKVSFDGRVLKDLLAAFHRGSPQRRRSGARRAGDIVHHLIKLLKPLRS